MLTRAWKTLFTYQFVIRTRPGVEPEASVGPSVRFGRFESAVGKIVDGLLGKIAARIEKNRIN
jgi:hypothetical protein